MNINKEEESEKQLKLGLTIELSNLKISLNSHMNIKYVNGLRKTCIDLCRIDLYLLEQPKEKINDFEICVKKFSHLIAFSKEELSDTVTYDVLPNILK